MEKDETLALKKEVTTRIDEGWSKGWSVSSFGLHAGALQIEKRYEEQAYTKQHLGEKHMPPNCESQRKAGLSTRRLLFSTCWLLIGWWCCFPLLMRIHLSLKTNVISNSYTVAYTNNPLTCKHSIYVHKGACMFRSCNAYSLHLLSIVKKYFYLPLVANVYVASRQRPAIRHGTFFSPDPGVSLQPSVVYSTSNSLVIAYVVIPPLENILWLQVTNLYCRG